MSFPSLKGESNEPIKAREAVDAIKESIEHVLGAGGKVSAAEMATLAFVFKVNRGQLAREIEGGKVIDTVEAQKTLDEVDAFMAQMDLAPKGKQELEVVDLVDTRAQMEILKASID